jgi:hypothetical protein
MEPSFARGIPAAILSASPMSRARIRIKPPRGSLAFLTGPSFTETFFPLTATLRAAFGEWSASAMT